MNTKLYVGNLPFNLKLEDLKEMFETAGTVTDAMICTDRDTGRSKGFGFVTYETEEAAQIALDKINEHEVLGRALIVSEARERSDNFPRLRPINLGKGTCIFCGRETITHGFNNNEHPVGACPSCIKALNYSLRR